MGDIVRETTDEVLSHRIFLSLLLRLKCGLAGEAGVAGHGIVVFVGMHLIRFSLPNTSVSSLGFKLERLSLDSQQTTQQTQISLQ